MSRSGQQSVVVWVLAAVMLMSVVMVALMSDVAMRQPPDTTASTGDVTAGPGYLVVNGPGQGTRLAVRAEVHLEQ